MRAVVITRGPSKHGGYRAYESGDFVKVDAERGESVMSQIGDPKICHCSLPYHECCGRTEMPWLWQPQVFTATGTTGEQCQHCYCQEVSVGIVPHVQCCNCGHKRIKLPISA